MFALNVAGRRLGGGIKANVGHSLIVQHNVQQ